MSLICSNYLLLLLNCIFQLFVGTHVSRIRKKFVFEIFLDSPKLSLIEGILRVTTVTRCPVDSTFNLYRSET